MMEKHPRFSEGWIHAGLNARGAMLDGGRLELCAGPRPATPMTPTPPDCILARLTLGSPAFRAASRGAIWAHPIAPDESALRAGRARWFRLVTMSGQTMVEGTVGRKHHDEADLLIDHPDIEQGAIVSVSSVVHSEPNR